MKASVGNGIKRRACAVSGRCVRCAYRYHAEVDEVAGLHLAQPGVALVVVLLRAVERRRVGARGRQRRAPARARVPRAEAQVLLVGAPLHQPAHALRTAAGRNSRSVFPRYKTHSHSLPNQIFTHTHLRLTFKNVRLSLRIHT